MAVLSTHMQLVHCGLLISYKRNGHKSVSCFFWSRNLHLLIGSHAPIASFRISDVFQVQSIVAHTNYSVTDLICTLNCSYDLLRKLTCSENSSPAIMGGPWVASENILPIALAIHIGGVARRSYHVKKKKKKKKRSRGALCERTEVAQKKSLAIT